ncbi:hypothetical protein [Flavobacterium okayamense]|uniref:DUF4252 domain-containing protein n=1 Tax=Flavobacterium okayamense TaxID=2830782 RepID=A0ABN6I0J4_9FLAO|nr:hypothetical protein [Flavobacterium okayamense]BCY29540.1 hypothetical protein KK2020170_24080 [Flavobacterium okayamense]
MKFIFIFLFSFSTFYAQNSLKDIIENKVSEIIQGANDVTSYIFISDSLNNISDKNLKNEINEFKKQIDETTFKLKKIKTNKVDLIDRNFFLKEVYSIENVKIFIAVIHFKNNSDVETLSFQVLKVNNYIGIINVHGQLVDDILIGPEDRVSKKSP